MAINHYSCHFDHREKSGLSEKNKISPDGRNDDLPLLIVVRRSKTVNATVGFFSEPVLQV
jgi:hypothetical protein